MLKDLAELLDRPANRSLTGDDFAAAADRLLRSQFIYRDDWGDKGTYDLLMAHRGYFEKLFSALGRDLVVSPHENMIGVMPQKPTARTGFTLEETVLLLMLRFLYDEALSRFEAGDQGEVATTSMDLLEKFETVSGRQRPERGRVKQILEGFQRRKLVQIGEPHPDELGWDVIIRPAIRIVAGQGYLKRLEDFAGSDAAREAIGLPPLEEGSDSASEADAEKESAPSDAVEEPTPSDAAEEVAPAGAAEEAGPAASTEITAQSAANGDSKEQDT